MEMEVNNDFLRKPIRSLQEKADYTLRGAALDRNEQKQRDQVEDLQRQLITTLLIQFLFLP